MRLRSAMLVGGALSLAACGGSEEPAVDAAVTTDAGAMMCTLGATPTGVAEVSTGLVLYPLGSGTPDGGVTMDGGTAADAGAMAADSGEAADGGEMPDSGEAADGGEVADAAVAEDAGGAAADAGAAGDAGAVVSVPVMAVPTGTGGDPTGTWVAESITFYYPETAGAIVSSATGSAAAWFRFENGMYETATDGNIVIATSTIPIHTKTQAMYTVSGSEIVSTPTCNQASTTERLTFSQSGDTITFIARQAPNTSLAGAVIYVVIEARRAS